MYENKLIKNLLNQLDITDPSQKQLDLAKKLFLRITIDSVLNFDPKLAESEVECLFLIAHGYTAPQMAESLNKKLSTIESYQKELKRKLKCHTIAQAVFRGIKFGYLSTIHSLVEEHFI